MILLDCLALLSECPEPELGIRDGEKKVAIFSLEKSLSTKEIVQP